jgi:hypothetical protein
MRNIKFMQKFVGKISLLFLLILLVAACGPADDQEKENVPQPTTAVNTVTPEPSSSEDGYPGVANTDSGYPGIDVAASDSGYPGDTSREELLDAPPDIEADIPAPPSGSGAVGGVLVQEVTGEGYLPFDPYELILAEMIVNNKGEPALISFNEQSPRAETFPTGIFIFSNVPPGTYGLVVNTAVNQFPLQDADGDDLLFDVVDGQALDMGQVFVRLP